MLLLIEAAKNNNSGLEGDLRRTEKDDGEDAEEKLYMYMGNKGGVMMPPKVIFDSPVTECTAGDFAVFLHYRYLFVPCFSKLKKVVLNDGL